MKHLSYIGLGLVFCMAACPAGAASEKYIVDATHSAALFKVKHFGVSFVAGSFTDISGTIVVDPENLDHSRAEVVIKTASVNTHLQKRDDHLRNADFLDVEKYPAMTFTSSRFKKLEENVAEVTGLLTLHGVAKSITTTVTFLGEADLPWGPHIAGFETSFSINRSDYGMKKLLGPAGDYIQITLLVEGAREDKVPRKATD